MRWWHLLLTSGALACGSASADNSWANGWAPTAYGLSADPDVTDTLPGGIAAETRIDPPRMRWMPNPPGVPDNGLPDTVLALDDDIRHLILVDLPRSRLFLLENAEGRPRVLRHTYASMGKNGFGKQSSGDGRTPLGVYTVTTRIDDADLPDLYGTGAFPVDYPNAWDERHERTGYGIWVHGVPHAVTSRPPQSSEGCVTVSNAELEALKAFVQPGNTRVVFSDGVQWLSPEEYGQRRRAFLDVVENWRSAWSAIDTEAYLGFYADDFSTDDMDYWAFARHKRRVNASKSFIDVQLSDLNVIRYPADEELMLVEFAQKYRSSNYRSTNRKQQIWRRNDAGKWQIVQELSS